MEFDNTVFARHIEELDEQGKLCLLTEEGQRLLDNPDYFNSLPSEVRLRIFQKLGGRIKKDA